MDHNRHDSGKSGIFAARANIVLVGFLAIGGFFLVTEHRAHLIPVLPWLLLLSCPLMHLFMHHGHGGHGGARHNASPDDRPAPPSQH